MSHHHFTYSERLTVQISLQLGISKQHIADALGLHRSSVYREIERNCEPGRPYDALQAEALAQGRRSEAATPPKLDHKPLREYVEEKLQEEWSPDQIAETLKHKHPGQARMQVSYETIYKHVYADKQGGGDLHTHLRRGHKKRRKRGGKNAVRSTIKNRTPIAERPLVVHDQSRDGDWEGDTMRGKNHKSNIAIFVERKNLYLRATLMEDKSAASLNKAACKAFQSVRKALRHTLTLDNGTEFARHEELSGKLGIDIYFARPYTSNDRAICENTIGLLRQYLPKGTDFNGITQEQLNEYVEKLNNRPRKKLGYRTPAQMMRVAIQT
jgi:IS30 family transposase